MIPLRSEDLCALKRNCITPSSLMYFLPMLVKGLSCTQWRLQPSKKYLRVRLPPCKKKDYCCSDNIVVHGKRIIPFTPIVKPWVIQSFLTSESKDRTFKCDHSLESC